MVMDGSEAISIDVVAEAGFNLVRVSGDIDIYTQQHLVDVFAEGGRLEESKVVIVDLDSVDFLDSMGLAALVRARRLLTTRGGELRLVCGEKYSRRVLRMARLESVLNLSTTIVEATGQPRPAT